MWTWSSYPISSTPGRSFVGHGRRLAPASTGLVDMTLLLCTVLLTPTALFLTFGLMYVLMRSPRDKKALVVLQLLPKSPTQLISSIIDMVRSSFKN